MPSYRYYTADVLTGEVQAELPLYGVFMDKSISRPGNFTGTFELGTGLHNDDLMLEGSTPGLRCIYCQRDDETIWGGIVWSRTYASNGRTAQLTAQTWESVFNHVVFEEHVIQQKIEQVTIFQNIINQMQAQAGNDFNFVLDLPAATGVTRTVLLPNYEFHVVNDALSELIVENGLEYTINLSSDEIPTKTIKVGYPRIEQASDNAFDFPGQIVNYWYPENASRGAVKFAAMGAGSGNKVLRAVAIDGDKLAAGWPSWWQSKSYPYVGDQETINDKARLGLEERKIPISAPTFELSKEAQFESWNSLGDIFQVHIEDTRFPQGKTITERLIAWEFTPEQTESNEIIRFAVEGAEE